MWMRYVCWFHCLLRIRRNFLSICNHAMWGHAMITDVKLYIYQAASSTRWGFFHVYNTVNLVKHVAIRLIVIKMDKATTTEYNENFFHHLSFWLVLSVAVEPSKCTHQNDRRFFTYAKHLCLGRANKTSFWLLPLKMLLNMYKFGFLSLHSHSFSLYRATKDVQHISIWKRLSHAHDGYYIKNCTCEAPMNTLDIWIYTGRKLVAILIPCHCIK